MQQFSRDVDELEIWISEKLQMAMEESYKDPSNIQVRFIHCKGPLRFTKRLQKFSRPDVCKNASYTPLQGMKGESA